MTWQRVQKYTVKRKIRVDRKIRRTRTEIGRLGGSVNGRHGSRERAGGNGSRNAVDMCQDELGDWDR